MGRHCSHLPREGNMHQQLTASRSPIGFGLPDWQSFPPHLWNDDFDTWEDKGSFWGGIGLLISRERSKAEKSKPQTMLPCIQSRFSTVRVLRVWKNIKNYPQTQRESIKSLVTYSVLRIIKEKEKGGDRGRRVLQARIPRKDFRFLYKRRCGCAWLSAVTVRLSPLDLAFLLFIFTQ